MATNTNNIKMTRGGHQAGGAGSSPDCFKGVAADLKRLRKTKSDFPSVWRKNFKKN